MPDAAANAGSGAVMPTASLVCSSRARVSSPPRKSTPGSRCTRRNEKPRASPFAPVGCGPRPTQRAEPCSDARAQNPPARACPSPRFKNSISLPRRRIEIQAPLPSADWPCGCLSRAGREGAAESAELAVLRPTSRLCDRSSSVPSLPSPGPTGPAWRRRLVRCSATSNRKTFCYAPRGPILAK